MPHTPEKKNHSALGPANPIGKHTRGKKKRQSHQSYRPGHTPNKPRGKKKKSTKLNVNPHTLRLNHSKTYIDVNGKEQPIEIVAYSNPGFLSPVSTARFKQKNKKLHQPKLKPTEYSPGGRVTAAVTRTPRKRRFRSQWQSGPISFLGPMDPKPALNAASTFTGDHAPAFNAAAFEAVKRIAATNKIKSVTISQGGPPEHPQRSKVITQNRLMARKPRYAKIASANTYVRSVTKVAEDAQLEWLHLIAYQLLGVSAQHEDNIIAGTKQANDFFTVLENVIRRLSEHFPVEIEVHALLIPNTHIGQHVTYNICVAGKKIPFNIDSQTQDQPYEIYQRYINNYFDVIKERYKEKLEQSKLATEVSIEDDAPLTLPELPDLDFDALEKFLQNPSTIAIPDEVEKMESTTIDAILKTPKKAPIPEKYLHRKENSLFSRSRKKLDLSDLSDQVNAKPSGPIKT